MLAPLFQFSARSRNSLRLNFGRVFGVGLANLFQYSVSIFRGSGCGQFFTKPSAFLLALSSLIYFVIAYSHIWFLKSFRYHPLCEAGWNGKF